MLSEVSSKATIENKINHTALLISYMLEFGIDLQRRIINITGPIDETQFEIVDAGMTLMESMNARKDIIIKINSPGGSAYQAMAIIGRMKESTCKTITKGYGQVMSAATLILASGTRRRMMSTLGFFMWHEAEYDPGSDRHSNHKSTVRQVEKEEELWAKRMADVSNKNPKFWREKGTHVDVYFSAEDLLKMEVVDELF